jgi:hypothetical protein
MQWIPERRYTPTICRLVVVMAIVFFARIGHGQGNTIAADAIASELNYRFLRPAPSPAVISLIAFSEEPTNPEAGPVQAPTQAEIEREARRLQLGVRGGVALDPELIMFGVQSQLGPIFRSNVFFRPSVEFGFGEVTAMFGFNGEFIYRLQMSSAQDRWTPYFGAGLGINLLHQNFERDNGGRRIDFGDFHSDSALNIVAGARYRSGVFLEARTSIYSDPSPTLRLMVGYSF